MQNWSAALLAGSLQLLLAQLFLRRHDGLLAKCIRRWPFKPLFTRSLKLDSRLIPAFVHHSHRRHSGAQRHWDVLRSHVLEQGRAKRSRESQHNKGETSRETLRKTVHQHVRYHKESQADDLQYFLTSFKKSQAHVHMHMHMHMHLPTPCPNPSPTILTVRIAPTHGVQLRAR